MEDMVYHCNLKKIKINIFRYENLIRMFNEHKIKIKFENHNKPHKITN